MTPDQSESCVNNNAATFSCCATIASTTWLTMGTNSPLAQPTNIWEPDRIAVDFERTSLDWSMARTNAALSKA